MGNPSGRNPAGQFTAYQAADTAILPLLYAIENDCYSELGDAGLGIERFIQPLLVDFFAAGHVTPASICQATFLQIFSAMHISWREKLNEDVLGS